MAGAKHLIVVPDDERPWSLLFEIADVTTPGEWVLVGGLMVHAHALRAGITASRPTTSPAASVLTAMPPPPQQMTVIPRSTSRRIVSSWTIRRGRGDATTRRTPRRGSTAICQPRSRSSASTALAS